MENQVYKDFTEVFSIRLNNWNQFKYPRVEKVVKFLVSPYSGKLCSHQNYRFQIIQ